MHNKRIEITITQFCKIQPPYEIVQTPISLNIALGTNSSSI
jgi:hypothetical protein